jgi:hypothetical protein
MDVDISLNLLTNELDAKDIAAAKKAATSVTTEEIND